MQATFELAQTQTISTISLDRVAAAAGVSVQTVLRQFGSRAGLIEATIAFATDAVREERRAPIGDVDTAMRVLLDHYEQRGDLALLLLSQENDEDVAPIVAGGRAVHENWVREVFAPSFADVADPDELFDLLVVVTDVYAWKQLRRDRELPRRVTEQRMKSLVCAVLASAQP